VTRFSSRLGCRLHGSLNQVLPRVARRVMGIRSNRHGTSANARNEWARRVEREIGHVDALEHAWK
jgi:hypothetical protein